MITLESAFSWLNQFNVSHLTSNIRQIVDHWMDSGISDITFGGIKQRALLTITDLDPLERPEVLLAAALAENRRGQRDASRNSIREALKLYPETLANRHRRAVALWMAGILEYQALENMTAYSCWQAARLIFETLGSEARAVRDAEKARWYFDRVFEMRLEMAFTAEEAYTWLNVFPPPPGRQPWLGEARISDGSGSASFEMSHARPAAGLAKTDSPAYIIIDKVYDQARKHHYATARRFMDQLRFLSDRSPHHTEKPQVWLECGLAAHQMNLTEEAVELLRHASAMYGQRSHEQAVAFWMLGAVVWQMEDRRHEIIPYWEQAVSIFQDLETRSDHQNRQGRRDWYHHLLEILPLALAQRASSL